MFTITATNNSSVDAYDVSVDASLPAFTEFSGVIGKFYDSETGVWNIGTLKAGQNITFTVKAIVTIKGVYKYPVYVSATEDTDSSNNTSETSYTVAVLHRLMKQNNVLGGFVYNKDAVPAFSDIKGRWDRSAIEYLTYRGAYNSSPASPISPDYRISRGEAFKLICLGLGFTDDSSLTLDEYAAILTDAGFVCGYSDGSLKLDIIITRAEFCKIYNIIIGRENASPLTASDEKTEASTYGFTDLDSSDWYYEIMVRATSAYDDNSYIDISKRGIRNRLDDYAE